MNKLKDRNLPDRYLDVATGIRCDDICADMPMFLGNAFKYIFRYLNKGEPCHDLTKAIDSILLHKYKARVSSRGYQMSQKEIELSLLMDKPLIHVFVKTFRKPHPSTIDYEYLIDKVKSIISYITHSDTP